MDTFCFPDRQPELCQACERGECWDCGMQTWCECECAGPDGCYIWDPHDEPMVQERKRHGAGFFWASIAGIIIWCIVIPGVWWMVQ